MLTENSKIKKTLACKTKFFNKLESLLICVNFNSTFLLKILSIYKLTSALQSFKLDLFETEQINLVYGKEGSCIKYVWLWKDTLNHKINNFDVSTGILILHGWQDSLVAECLPKD